MWQLCLSLGINMPDFWQTGGLTLTVGWQLCLCWQLSQPKQERVKKKTRAKKEYLWKVEVNGGRKHKHLTCWKVQRIWTEQILFAGKIGIRKEAPSADRLTVEPPKRKNRESPFLQNWGNRKTKFKDSLFFTWVWYFNCWLIRALSVFSLYLLFILNYIISPKVGWLVGFLTSSSTTRLYRGRALRQSVWQFYVLSHMRQSWETMTSVSAGHIILTPTQPVGSGRPQQESNPGPPHQESRALPTELPHPPSPKGERQ